MKRDPKTTAARAFVRSLNILLKFARLYGHDHIRVANQLATAWAELRTAVPEGSETGLLLGATGSQLLLDGVPLESTPAEKQFAQLLSSAGLASLQFTPGVTPAELAKFASAFPTGKAKPAELVQRLKTALSDVQGIGVNEICFVATDSRLKDTSVAAQIAAASMGSQQDQFRKMLNDPKKVLELIAAAEGSKSGAEGGSGEGLGPRTGTGVPPGSGLETDSGSGSGAGTVAGGTRGGSALAAGTAFGFGLKGAGFEIGTGFGSGLGVGRGSGGSGGPDEESMCRILRAIATLGSIGTSRDPQAATVEFQDQVGQLPGNAQDTLRQALAGLAEQGKNKKLDESVLIQLAEHLSIRFAMEQFERGDVKVNAVRQMLDRMNQEIEQLRKLLGQHEDKMVEAGILVESHREMLDRQFWATVP